MTALTFREAQEIDRSIQRDTDEASTERMKTFDRDMRKTNVVTNGPSEEIYDYQAGYNDNVNFQQEDGSVRFPNKYTRDLTIAGRDISTGERQITREDPDGFGKAGYDGMRNSFTDNVNGQPNEDYDPMVYLAMEHLQNGGKRGDFALPFDPEMTSRSFDTVDAIMGIDNIGKEIDAVNAEAPEALASPDYRDIERGDPDDETLTEEQLGADAKWIEAGNLIAKHRGVDVAAENLNETAIEEMAYITNNTLSLGNLVYSYESGDMDEPTAKAYAYALQQYDRLTMFNGNVFQGALMGIATDPLTYSTAAIGKLAVMAVTKKAGLRFAIRRLLATKGGQVAATAGAASAAGAYEGGAIGTAYETARQAVGGEGYNLKEIGIQGLSGSIAGGIFGAGLGAALSTPARKGIVDAYTSVTDYIAETSVKQMGTLEAQRGAVSLTGMNRKITEVPPTPETTSDFGVYMAGNAKFKTSWHTTLSTNVSARWDKSFQTGGASEKPIKPERVLEELDRWMKKPEAGVESFKDYEIENTGLHHYLNSKVEAKEKVTKEEVEDFLWANEPIINSNVSSRDNYTQKGHQSYDRKLVRDEIALRLFSDRNYDLTPSSNPRASYVEQKKEVDIEINTLLDEIEDYRESLIDWNDMQETGVDMADIQMPTKPTTSDTLRGLDPEFATEADKWLEKEAAEGLDNPYWDNEAPPFPQTTLGKPEAADMKTVLTNKATGEVRSYDDWSHAKNVMKAEIRNMTADMRTDQLIDMARQYDESLMMAPPRYTDLTLDGFGGGNYREMRLYYANEPRGNVQDIAMDRFGDNYDSLSAPLKKRADRIKALNSPVGPIVEQKQHYPFETNRIGHIRMQDIYDADGNKVLGVLEYQNDAPMSVPSSMHPVRQVTGDTYYKNAKDAFTEISQRDGVPDDLWDQIVYLADKNREGKLAGKDDGLEYVMMGSADEFQMEPNASSVKEGLKGYMDLTPELEKAVDDLFLEAPQGGERTWQPVEGADAMLANRMLQYASENGYTKLMIPANEATVAKVQGWKGSKHEKTVNRYTKSVPIHFNKRVRKRWNIKSLTKAPAYLDGKGVMPVEGEQMWVIEFGEGGPPKGAKAMYSVAPASIATSAGTEMMGQEEEK